MISNLWIPPVFILLVGSLAVPFIKNQKYKNAYLLILPVIALADVIFMGMHGYGSFYTINFLSYKLVFARVDKLSLIFGYIFTIAAFIGTLYSIHLKNKLENISAFFYAGSALGVVFAGDFFSLFIFWEIMAIGSGYLIWARKTKEAQSAGFRYFVVHFLGGLLLLFGIFLYASETHSIAFNLMSIEEGGLAVWLILLGFALNCAIPPLSAWLSDAYPEATITGTVFLSAFTTKTAVYVLIRGFRGTEILIWLGAIMAFYGVVYAVLANDIRRILAYHIISQVGFMVAGIGIGTELAINGAVAHAFAHILYKGLLFMGAGAVMTTTGRSKMSDLGGIYKKMPWAFSLYMIGAFSISGFPLFSGFVSKSMVITAAEEHHLTWIWLLLIVSSAGTWLHTGLKLPWFTWMGKDRDDIEAQEPPHNMLYAMGIAAALSFLIGAFPHIFYKLLPFKAEYLPYTYNHVVWTMQYLMFTAVAFFAIIKYLHAKPHIFLDTDWFYRRTKPAFVNIAKAVTNFNISFEATLEKIPYYLSLTKKRTMSIADWFETIGMRLSYYLSLTKKPILSMTNYSTDLLFAIWVDFWLVRPTADLFSTESKTKLPLVDSLIFKPFNWLVILLGHVGNALSNIAARIDSLVVDRAAQEAANVLFSNEVATPLKEFEKRVINELTDEAATVIYGNVMSSSAKLFDKIIVDGVVDGVAKVIFFVGERARRIQTGFVQNYALIIVFVVAILIFMLSLKGGLL